MKHAFKTGGGQGAKKQTTLLNKEFFYSILQSARNSFLPMIISAILMFYTNGAPDILQLALTKILTFFPPLVYPFNLFHSAI